LMAGEYSLREIAVVRMSLTMIQVDGALKVFRRSVRAMTQVC
jgi:hypothetical protein